MDINIDMILDDLKEGKSQRTKDSLDSLNTLLETEFNKDEHDYSIAHIGRLSKASGGISTVSIRNKSGNHYRLLIDAWATKANTTMKKPPSSQSRKYDVASDMELLKYLSDPAMRAVFGQIIAEKNKLKSENRILKQNIEVNIDMRPNKIAPINQNSQVVQVLPSLNGVLLNGDIEALQDAIKEEKINKLGWTVTEYGGIKDEFGRNLFKTGFILAIQKVLAQV